MPFPAILLHDVVEIVDVVQEDVFQHIDRWIDVTRHGNVNKKHRPAAPGSECLTHHRRLNNWVRRTGRADDNIRIGQMLGEHLPGDRFCLQRLGQEDSPLGGPVGNKYSGDALTDQVAHRQFGGIPSP